MPAGGGAAVTGCALTGRAGLTLVPSTFEQPLARQPAAIVARTTFDAFIGGLPLRPRIRSPLSRSRTRVVPAGSDRPRRRAPRAAAGHRSAGLIGFGTGLF